MSDTIPDISLGPDVYVDLNTLSGVAVGTPLVVSNKSHSPIRLQQVATQPDDNSTEGMILAHMLHPNARLVLDAGESTLWGKSGSTTNARISVQDDS